MNFLSYSLIRIFTFPIRFLSYPSIHRFGEVLGNLFFHLIPHYRKRTLSNLALAKSLNLSNSEILILAKKSFGNLIINCLEYAKLAVDRQIEKTVILENIEIAKQLQDKDQGLIFFCAHQANWEVLFLYATLYLKGIAIGKEIKNKHLYRWIISIRQKNGGRVISTQNALREGLKALKTGLFLGIVGDQATPGTGYSSLFLGRPAWTSSAPALLAYKMNCPVFFVEARRNNGKYHVKLSHPIWPDQKKPLDEEVPRMMDEILDLTQESIKNKPEEWMWQHNRWKQQTVKTIKRVFRHDSICIMLPLDQELFKQINIHLITFKQIYPTESFFLFTHPQNIPSIPAEEIFYYQTQKELLREDYRFKLIFNFTGYKPVKSHYLQLSAFEVLSIKDLARMAKKPIDSPLSDLLKEVLCP